ncbi:MAG: polysaccharide biosynthesis/export family protein [Vicinamibacteria bacterium]
MKGKNVMGTSARVALAALGFTLGLSGGVAAELSPVPQEPARDATAGGSAAPGYTIGPADVLQIVVWKEPDLSRDAIVRFDGMITVPLLGDVQAAGRTPAAVAESISKGLERFVQVPQVTVGVGQATSARFYVIGQVTKSGDFPLSGRTTVLQGLALAGGFKDFAKTENIVLIRRDQTVTPVNYKRIADGKDASQNVVLSPGDTIVVP